jgi:hypothetical protein
MMMNNEEVKNKIFHMSFLIFHLLIQPGCMARDQKGMQRQMRNVK